MENKLDQLIGYLLNEKGDKDSSYISESEDEKFKIYRGLVNKRLPFKADEEYLRIEDQYLTDLIQKKGITDIESLTPLEGNIYLWQGDITTLKCGAIVNAANKKLLGCFIPCHSCIDNCIHTFAGIRLRSKCLDVTKGEEEPTGKAKITPAYNLPCDYVIHTVGPIVDGELNDEHKRLLESSYRSCLETAVQNDIKSIAFCCISTGVFGFPQEEAAEIAVRTVRDFCKTHDIKVIFNVFGDKDKDIYQKILMK